MSEHIPVPKDVARALRILERRHLHEGESRGVARSSSWLLEQAKEQFAKGEDNKARWLRDIASRLREASQPERPADTPADQDWAWGILWDYAEDVNHG